MKPFYGLASLVLFLACAPPSTEPPLHEEAAASDRAPAVPLRREGPPTPRIEAQPAPPYVETRSRAELDQAACTTPQGGWRCRAPKPVTFATTGTRPPILPYSWTLSAWFIDPANASGAAADSNNCTSSATPCLTWHEIHDGRWGCIGDTPGCPRFRQAMTATWLSSDTTDTDPIYFSPAIEASSAVTLTGILNATTQIATATMSAKVAKNRATPQLLNFTLTGGLATRQLLKNDTTGGFAWTYTNTAGNAWDLLQAFTTASLIASSGPVENDASWTNGDTFHAYAPAKVNIVSLRPVLDTIITTPLVVSNLTLNDPATPTDSADPVWLEGAIAFASDSFLRTPTTSTGSTRAPGLKFTNCVLQNGALLSGASAVVNSTGLSVPSFDATLGGVTVTQVYGGLVLNVASVGGVSFTNVMLDYDVLLNAHTGVSGTSFYGGVYLDVSRQFSVNNGFFTETLIGATTTNGIFWGNGIVNTTGAIALNGMSRWAYSSTGSGAVNTFLTIGANRLIINGSNTACGDNNSQPTVTNCLVTLTAAHLDAAQGLAGFGGRAYKQGGSSFVNTAGQ